MNADAPAVIVSFFAQGDPKGQPRPRAFAMKIGGTFQARVFDSGTAEGWKSQIAVAARPVAPAAPILGPVKVRLDFMMRRPRSHYRTGAKADQLRPDAPLNHTAKFDLDNLCKAVLDGLTQLGSFWRDDSQVACLEASKRYGQQPGVAVEIMEMMS
jgi:crossover junction endodeoxyribonuclease RusA